MQLVKLKTQTKLKKLALYTMIGVSLLSLGACGKDEKEAPKGKTYTEAQYNNVVNQYNTLANNYKALQQKYEANNQTASNSSLTEIAGSGAIEFNTIEDMIKFPTPLTVPMASADSNATTIRIGSNFFITPSDNWFVRLNGTTANFQHPSKIWGKVKTIRVNYPDDEYPTVNDIKRQVDKFYTKFKSTDITYRRVFFGGQAKGVLSKAKITVDKKTHYLNVGYFLKGDYAVLIMFDYEENNTGVQQELIESLLNTINSGGNDLRLE